MFIFENGSGVTDSNSYVSLIESDAYHSLRGNTNWVDADDSAKETALVKASQFFDIKLGKVFEENPTNIDQGLILPTDRISVNVKLKNAINEYALIALTLPLIKTKKSNSSDKIKSTKVKVGPIEKEVALSTVDGSKELNIEEFPLADELFNVFLKYVKSVDFNLIKNSVNRTSRA